MIVRPSSARVAVKAIEARVDICEMPGRLLRLVPLPTTRDLVPDLSAGWRADGLVRLARCPSREVGSHPQCALVRLAEDSVHCAKTEGRCDKLKGPSSSTSAHSSGSAHFELALGGLESTVLRCRRSLNISSYGDGPTFPSPISRDLRRVDP